MKKKKTAKKKENKELIKNIIFIFLVIFIVGIIFILSSNTNKKGNSDGLFTFNTSDFSNITAIGLSEYQASLSYAGESVIFVCSNESEECYNVVENLNSIAKNRNLSIEYLNILELVDSEKEELESLLPGFEKQEYPYLVIISNEKSTVFNEYLEKDQIETILIENKIIR